MGAGAAKGYQIRTRGVLRLVRLGGLRARFAHKEWEGWGGVGGESFNIPVLCYLRAKVKGPRNEILPRMFTIERASALLRCLQPRRMCCLCSSV